MNTSLKKIREIWKNRDHKTYTIYNFVQLAALTASTSKNPDKSLVFYNILRRMFTPVSSEVKLMNGRRPFDALNKFTVRGAMIHTFGKWHERKSVLAPFFVSTIETLLNEEERIAYMALVSTFDPSKIPLAYPEKTVRLPRATIPTRQETAVKSVDIAA